MEVRRGEQARAAFMFLYLMFVLAAYYVLKSSSRALFLNRFDQGHLPYLYLVQATSGAVMASIYVRAASRWSLKAALEASIAVAVLCLIALWQLLGLGAPWVYYVLNVWVSLFSLVLVSQGWLLASHVFDAREAKRVYPLVASGGVLGAALGGLFTQQFARALGTRDLVFVSSGFILLALASFRGLLRAPGVNIAQARAESAPAGGYSPAEILLSVARIQHLRVIVGLIVVTYVVDQLVEYQFNVIARQSRQGDDLTAFLGGFYGIWLNLATFVLQIFVTSLVVNLTGIGGTLLMIPAAIGAASLYMLISPGLAAVGAARIAEAAMRYSFNRTGMELLYLPLPDELRQKTKTFVDVFVDRSARGLAALLILGAGFLFKDNLQVITIIVLVFCAGWGALAVYARREYIATVRRRLESRRLDLESMRIPYQDPSLLQMLADAARSGNERAAVYAISMLNEVPNYPLDLLALRLIDQAPAGVRAQLFEIGQTRGWQALLPAARNELSQIPGPALSPALRLLCSLGADDDRASVRKLLSSPDLRLVEAAVLAAVSPGHLPLEWAEEALASSDQARRRLGVLAVSLHPQHATRLLMPLLSDPDAGVRRAAQEVLAANARHTAAAIAAVIADSSTPMPRRMLALRTLGRSSSQEAVDALRNLMSSPDRAIRGAAVRALARLQDKQHDLQFSLVDVTAGVRMEAREYFWLHTALSGLRPNHDASKALDLLCRTIENRMLRNVERVFRLLGLRYPPKDIEVAWKAYRRRKPNQVANAMEFLDNILDYDVKRLVLPLLEEDGVDRQARLLFGFEPLSAQSALRLLIREGDPWVAACAIAAAGDLKLREAESDIRSALQSHSPILHPVAEQALAMLANGGPQ